MTAQANSASTEPAEVGRPRSRLGNAWRALKGAPPTALFGLLMVVVYLTLTIFAPLIAPYGQADVVGPAYAPWSAKFLLGTDQIGRDMLTRLIYGARNTIGIAIITEGLSFSIGGIVGMFVAVVGGWPDQVAGRVVDILMAIPQLIFALMLLSIFGTSTFSLVIIIAVLDSTRVFRLARAAGMNIAVMDFVEAARLQGEKLPWIMIREILPNILAPLVAEFGVRFCFVFLTIADLSFLGLGIQPPLADWGSMVRENSSLIAFGIVTPLLPAGAIALLVVSVNFVVDWFLHKTSGLKDVR